MLFFFIVAFTTLLDALSFVEEGIATNSEACAKLINTMLARWAFCDLAFLRGEVEGASLVTIEAWMCLTGC